MHDSSIKTFCIWARRELISEVERRCALYDISASPENPANAEAVNGRVLTALERRQRSEILSDIAANGYDQVVERAAYTWFNRIMAIRFMELNDRLPSRTRMFTSNDGSFKPQVLSEALSADIEGIDRAKVAELVQNGDDEATFKYLFLAQCNELGQCMPSVFEKVGSAAELLLPDGLLRPDGVIAKMVSDIPEEDWREGVEIVGWMYQYYVSERKDEYFAAKRKATREDIAPATQLFTPEWIVRYLTQNSLGRLWMLNHPESNLAEQMEYYIALEDGSKTEFRKVDSPEDLTVVDPACGSGHILVYAFDLLAMIYEEQGYSRRDIPQLILQNNIHGLEIDPRAAAMANFALTMKACELDSRFLRRSISPNITMLNRIEFTEEERGAIARIAKEQESLDAPFLLSDTELMDVLAHLDEAGSLFVPTETNLNSIREAMNRIGEQDLFHHSESAEIKLKVALNELTPLARQYDAVIANPPYLANMDTWLNAWVKKNYPNENSDLCTCFITRGLRFANNNGFVAIITSDTCMYISSFEKMRKAILDGSTIVTFIDTRGTNAHPDVFDANAGWVLQKGSQKEYEGVYLKLNHSIREKQTALLEAVKNPDCGWFYRANQQAFKKIPGSPIAYWSSIGLFDAFSTDKSLAEIAKPRQGLATADNDRFLRLWWEPYFNNIGFGYENRADAQNSNLKWFPMPKGGEFRKWYGNLYYLVNWHDDGYEIRHFFDNKGKLKSRPQNMATYFKPGISWSAISSGAFAMRFIPKGFISNAKGPMCFGDEQDIKCALGVMNSSVAKCFLKILAPTLDYSEGPIGRVPITDGIRHVSESIATLVDRNIVLSCADWDSFETSWDFTGHPLLKQNVNETLQETYEQWKQECNDRFFRLKTNEEELNRIFAEIYGMEDEAPIDVPLDKVSVHYVVDTMDDLPENWGNTNYVRTKRDEIVSLIGYAIGCMMGRYSLDELGLILANQGEGLKEYLARIPEPTFMPDADGIIPFTDVEYFHDDATGFFIDFMRAAFGEEHLEENLQFVTDALGGSGTPRQVIREYFLNDFFADHCKTYSVQSAGKRPIYWLFDSGKKGGFRALFYMHRYTPDLLARLRTEYVHPQQERYRTQIAHIDDAMTTADKRELADLKKQRKKLNDQLDEITAYEEKVHHLADQMIEIDLDDGVKHNYALFQDVLAKIK